MTTKNRRLKVSAVLLTIVCAFTANINSFLPVNAYNPNGFPYNTILSCINRAYERGGKGANKFASLSEANKNAIPSIIAACNKCKERDWGKEHILTISALWFTGTDQDVLSNAAIVSASSNATEVEVKLNFATLSCNGNEDDPNLSNDRLARNNFNIQSTKVGNGECPEGTRLVNAPTHSVYIDDEHGYRDLLTEQNGRVVIANCKNDGISDKNVTALYPIWGWVTNKNLYIPKDDRDGTDESTMKSKDYIDSKRYTYTGNTVLPVNDGIANDWSKVSTGTVNYKININDFKSDDKTTNTHEGNMTVYTNPIQIFSCSRNSWPGMYVNEDGSTYHYGCSTDANQIVVKIEDLPTLTAYAAVSGTYNSATNTRTYLTSSGATTTDRTNSWTTQDTVDEYNAAATVDTSNFNPAGYSWDTWGSSCAESERNGRKCTKENLTSNTNVYAYYARNSFNARARVSNGTTWSGAYNADSGFVKESAPANNTTNIECATDSGCNATFWFNLKTIAGSGSTNYTIQKRSATKNEAGDFEWSDIDGKSNVSVSPSSSSNGTSIYVQTDNLAIGEKACYRVRYKPYGDEDNSTYKNVGACAYVKPSTFIGKTTVSGSASATAGYTSDSSPSSVTEHAYIENCSPTDGCAVTFKHYLKRTSGIAATTYTVTRSSRLKTSTKGISGGTIVNETTFSGDSGTLVNENKNLVLYPGQIVCEKLSFRPNNLPTTTDNIYTRVCVHVYGNAQPPDDPEPDKPEDPDKPSGDTSLLNIKVRNPDAADKYSNYQREVYAKPGDTVVYRATYNPVLQYTYYLVPQKMQINGGTIYPTDDKNSTLMMYNMFNNNKSSSLKNWNNAFSVQKGKNNASFSLISNHTYNGGDYTKRQETNDYKIESSDVGKSIDEKAVTNLNDDTKTTPSQVSFRDDGSGNNLANVITDRKESKIASAKVPYNFTNDTELINPENLKAYAGEPLTVSYKYIINPKTNSETSPNEPYATKVVNPQWRLAVKIGDGEWQNTTAQTQSSFSVSTSEMGTGKSYNRSTTINIPDVAAGTVVCVAPQVYPTNSGADTNYTNTKGSDAWTPIDSSKQTCFNVAKKPSIQIWGGNIYSRGAIETSVAAKNNLEGYTTYNLNNSDGNGKNRYIFGSWTESGLISNGRVKGLASGASTGFAINDNGTLWPAHHPEDGSGNNALVSGGNPAPGGSFEVNQNFCIRSVLTFANEGCNGVNGVAGGFNSTNVISSIENDKTTILRKFIPTSFDANTSGDVALNDDTKITDNGNYYYYGKDSLNVVGSSIRKDTIQVVHSDQNITISGDLVYDSAGGYATLEEIPKLVIYAQNVTIACSVSRIDALIVAENQVKTCDSDNNDDERNSNQLKINGAIIANSLDANRTYGAATGANSIIPAEIINYDPSLYLWGSNDTEDSASANNMDTTYIHEVAPRY